MVKALPGCLPCSDVDSHRLGHQFGDVLDRVCIPRRWHIPEMFMVQPASLQMTVFGAGGAMQLTLSSTIAPLMAGYLIGERSAETAALVGLFHRLELDVADLAEQANAFILDADAAEMAGVVIRDFPRLGQRELVEIDLQNLVQKFDEFVGL